MLTACASSTADHADPAATASTSVVAASGEVSDGEATGEASGDAVASTSGSATGSTEAPGVRPEGFDTTLARATLPDGSVCEMCVWLADTAPQRSQGLMFVTDLGPADAMAFRYPEPHTGSFWMKNTVLPLSIAFFAPDGAFMEAFDMVPCESDPCPSYPTPAGFSVAVEVPQGGLAELGLVDGSTLEILDFPCDA